MNRKLAFTILSCAVVLTACDASNEVSSVEQTRKNSPRAYYTDVLNPGNYTDAEVNIRSPFNPAIIDKYTYWAERWQGGPVQGKFSYTTTTQSGFAKVSGDVLCFTIVPEVAGEGPRARLGGVVRRSNTPDIPVGSELTWSVWDRWRKDGDPDDKASPMLGADAEAYCALGLPYPESDLRFYTYVYIE